MVQLVRFLLKAQFNLVRLLLWLLQQLKQVKLSLVGATTQIPMAAEVHTQWVAPL